MLRAEMKVIISCTHCDWSTYGNLDSDLIKNVENKLIRPDLNNIKDNNLGAEITFHHIETESEQREGHGHDDYNLEIINEKNEVVGEGKIDADSYTCLLTEIRQVDYTAQIERTR